MSEYTPNDEGPIVSPIPLPDDGTKRKAASVNTTFEALADNGAYLARARKFNWFNGPDPAADLDSLGEGRFQVPLMLPLKQSGHWEWDESSGIWYVDNTLSSNRIWFAVPAVPTSAQLTHVMLKWGGKIGPADTAHTNLPANMPKFTLYRQQEGDLISVGTATDTSANVTAYDAGHEVVLGPIAGPLYTSPGEGLLIKVEGESGVDAIDQDFAIVYATLRLLPIL